MTKKDEQAIENGLAAWHAENQARLDRLAGRGDVIDSHFVEPVDQSIEDMKKLCYIEGKLAAGAMPSQEDYKTVTEIYFRYKPRG